MRLAPIAISFFGFALCAALLFVSVAVVRHTAKGASKDYHHTSLTSTERRADDASPATPSNLGHVSPLTDMPSDEEVFEWVVSSPPMEWMAGYLAGGGQDDYGDAGPHIGTEAAVGDAGINPQHALAVPIASFPSATAKLTIFNNVAGIDFSPLTCHEPIDAVYTWVNGSEPYQQALIKQWQERTQLENETLRDELIKELLWMRWVRGDGRDRVIAGGSGGGADRSTSSSAHGPTSPSPSAMVNGAHERPMSAWKRRRMRAEGLKAPQRGTVPPSQQPSHHTSTSLQPSAETAAIVEKMLRSNRPTSTDQTDRTYGAHDEDDDGYVDHTQHEDQAGASRFADHDELRYSMRSLQAYSGWVRHVYLVTNGQVPTWLNLSHPKVTVITHEQLFLNASRDLPTFSSNAIEANLHRIPNLSRRFLYFNDDTFFAAPVTLEDFYSPVRGHRVYESWQVPGCAQGCPSQWLGDGQCDGACNIEECAYDLGDCPLPTEAPPFTAEDTAAGETEASDESMRTNLPHGDTVTTTGTEAPPPSPSRKGLESVGTMSLDTSRYCYVVFHTASDDASGDGGLRIDHNNSCLSAQVGNGVCEHACDRLECGYDGADCADTMAELCGGDMSVVSSTHHHEAHHHHHHGLCRNTTIQASYSGSIDDTTGAMHVALPIMYVMSRPADSDDNRTPFSLTIGGGVITIDTVIDVLVTEMITRAQDVEASVLSSLLALVGADATDLTTVQRLITLIHQSPSVADFKAELRQLSAGISMMESTTVPSPSSDDSEKKIVTPREAFLASYAANRSRWAAFLSTQGQSKGDESQFLRALLSEEKASRVVRKPITTQSPATTTSQTATAEASTPPTVTAGTARSALSLPTIFSAAVNFRKAFATGTIRVSPSKAREVLSYEKTLGEHHGNNKESTVPQLGTPATTTAPFANAINVSLPISYFTAVHFVDRSPATSIVHATTFFVADETLLMTFSQHSIRQRRSELLGRRLRAVMASCPMKPSTFAGEAARESETSTQATAGEEIMIPLYNASSPILAAALKELGAAGSDGVAALKACLAGQGDLEPASLARIDVNATARVWDDKVGAFADAHYSTMVSIMEAMDADSFVAVVGALMSSFASDTTPMQIAEEPQPSSRRNLLAIEDQWANETIRSSGPIAAKFRKAPSSADRQPIAANRRHIVRTSRRLGGAASLANAVQTPQATTAKTTRRHLTDLFGDSLRHTNMLLTKEYGAQTRRVPAHMVHLIDREAVKDVWSLWGDALNETCASRFRSKRNVQFALAHFYHIVHATTRRSFGDFVREEIKIAVDMPSPSSWLTYSAEEYAKRRAEPNSSSTIVVDSPTDPTIIAAEEFRRFGLLLWEEDMVDPEANINRLAAGYKKAVGIQIVRTEPPYMDRRRARERNEELLGRLCDAVHDEWSVYDVAEGVSNASVTRRSATAAEMFGPSGLWEPNTEGSFLPPTPRTAEMILDGNASIDCSTNCTVPVVAVPFGDNPHARVCAMANDAEVPHYNHSRYNVAHVVKAAFGKLFDALVAAVASANPKLSAEDPNVKAAVDANDCIRKRVLATIWAVESEVYQLHRKRPTNDGAAQPFASGDEQSHHSPILLNRDRHAYMNKTLTRQRAFLRMYKGIQPDGTVLDLVGGASTILQGSLSRDRERDDALLVTDSFYGKLLWLSHVASLRGATVVGEEGDSTLPPCETLALTDTIIDSHIAVLQRDLAELKEALGLTARSVVGTKLRAKKTPTTGDGFKQQHAIALHITSKILEGQGIDVHTATKVVALLEQLFFLHHTSVVPTMRIPISSEAELSSYMYSNEVYLPTTVSYVLQSTSTSSSSSSASLATSASDSESSAIIEGYTDGLRNVLYTCNEAVKRYDEDVRRAKEEAFEAARKRAALLGVDMTTTAKPRSLQEIAEANRASRWGRRHGGAKMGGEEVTVPPITKATLPPDAAAYYDDFFNDDKTPMQKQLRVLEGFLSLDGAVITRRLFTTSVVGTSSAEAYQLSGVEPLLKTTQQFAATMSATSWPTPPPLRSSQLENSLLGAVTVGLSVEHTLEGFDASQYVTSSPSASSSQPAPKMKKLPTPLVLQHYQRRMSAPFLYDLQKYSSETVSVDSPTSGVTFSMIRNNVTVVQDQCDHVRQKRPKFLCINDDMDHSEDGREGHVQVLKALRDLFEGYYPTPSVFERTDGVRNAFTRLTTEELVAIDQAKRGSKTGSPADVVSAGAHATVAAASTTVPRQQNERPRQAYASQSPIVGLSSKKLIAAFVFVAVSSIVAAMLAYASFRVAFRARQKKLE